jgi:hypothetical protein
VGFVDEAADDNDEAGFLVEDRVAAEDGRDGFGVMVTDAALSRTGVTADEEADADEDEEALGVIGSDGAEEEKEVSTSESLEV